MNLWKHVLAARVLFLGFLALPCAALGAQHEHDSPAPAKRAQPWSERTLELAGRLPVQDGGRVKPLSTYAAFTLLRLNGKRSIKTPDGEELKPTAWLLDALFYPHAAADYECFLVENPDVIAAIGLRFEDKKARDRFSLFELQPGFERLFDLSEEYAHIDEQSPLQRQIVTLASNVNAFFGLVGHLDYARLALPVGKDPEVLARFDGEPVVPFSQLVAKAGELRAIVARQGDPHGESGEEQMTPAFALLRLAADLSGAASTLALVPPTASAEVEEEWLTPGDLFYTAYETGSLDPKHREVLAGFEALARERDDPAAFERELESLLALSGGLADARGEYEKIGLEVTYYDLGLINRSLAFFVLSFLLASFLWLFPRGRAGRILHGGASGAVLVATILLVTAITMRCVIRGRPPVSTLYETLLFVTGVGSIVALVIEWINKRRVAVSIAALLGMIGLFLANKFESIDRQDTMPSLVAVLDTNFWLATHVTAITTGYAAGMLAAFLGSFYLLAKLVGYQRGNRAFYRNIARMVYGVLAFAVIFSTVGTILGGVWANDSWGRFWGWDPKENGALLIVLSQLAILHGRMGGYLREHGIAICAALGGTIVAFSWFGVNLLGVGLHSYGFTSGIREALWTYYYVQWGIAGLGGIAYLLERKAARAAAAAAAVPAEISAPERSRKAKHAEGEPDEPRGAGLGLDPGKSDPQTA